VPDEEKYEAFFRAQKNVAEKNRAEGVPAPGARLTAVLRSPSRRKATKRIQTVR